ncbi:MAG: cytochrome c1 [Magnetococcus sp. DMHC-6]
MKFKSIAGSIALLFTLLPLTVAQASSGAVAPPSEHWEFHGIFGRFDQAALKRGAQVATEVCLGCHSIKYIKFNQLHDIGFNEEQVIAMAESRGKTKQDRMVSALDDAAAKDAFGIIPPDLSLITKARKGYEDYIFGLLTGYLTEEDTNLVQQVMEDNEISESEALELASAIHVDPHHMEKIKEVIARINNGDHFNKYFPGFFFAMPAPLADGSVEYSDGTETSKKQLAKDVTTFLAWAAEPTQTQRKSTGLNVILYLVIFTALLYAMKRRIWAKIH